jgi:hypothetical protein
MQQEKLLPSLLCNILIPVLLLTQGDRLLARPAIVLVLALVFPAGYFVWDLRRRRKANFISILGFVSVLLTGGVGLLQLPRVWYIVKETAIPALIGIAVLVSLRTRYPLVRTLLFSPHMFDVERIQGELARRGTGAAMERLLARCTLLLAGSFFLSALLNALLASWFIRTEPSEDFARFNAEVGAMTGWSYLIIALPSMAILAAILWHLFHRIRDLTGLAMDDLLAAQHRQTG